MAKIARMTKKCLKNNAFRKKSTDLGFYAFEAKLTTLYIHLCNSSLFIKFNIIN